MVNTIHTYCDVMFVAAPPLSVDKVMSALQGLAEKWEKVGTNLSIPKTTLRAIKTENTEDVDRLRTIIIYWLHRDPEASWRKLIHRLDYYSKDEYFQQTADTIRNYAEKLSGQSVSHNSG